MPKEFINPNLHVILIHYPLGLITVGALIEIFSFLGWRRSTFRAAGRWMLLVGILSLTPALFSGLYALADVNRTTPIGSDDMSWAQVRQESPVQGAAWDFLTRHAWSNAIGTVVLLSMLVLWMGSSDEWRRKLHLIYVLILLLGLGTLVFGAWHGGEAVYRHGVGVEQMHADATSDHDLDAGGPTDLRERLAYYSPPLQLHVILAGAAVSLALAALGVSLRAGSLGDRRGEVVGIDGVTEQGGIASALNPSLRPQYPSDYPSDPNEPSDIPAISPRRRPAAARFWLLAAVLAMLTSLAGIWTLAVFADVWNLNDLWQMVIDTDTFGWRRLAHTIAGSAIVLLLLMLAVVARVSLGRRIIVLVFTLLLVIAVLAQVWFGSLLMFDSPMGPPGSFNESEAALSEVVPADEPLSPARAEPAATAATTPATP